MSIITRPQNDQYSANFDTAFPKKSIEPICTGCGQKRWSISYDHGYKTLTCKYCKTVCVQVKEAQLGVYEFKEEFPRLALGRPEKTYQEYAQNVAAAAPITPQHVDALQAAPEVQLQGLLSVTRFTRCPSQPIPDPPVTVQPAERTCGGCGRPESHCRCPDVPGELLPEER